MPDKSAGLLATLRRLLGAKHRPPPAPRVSRASAQATLPSPFAKPEAQVKYLKERISQRFRADPRAKRKRWLIIGGAAAAMLVVGVVLVVLFILRTTVPEALRGTWNTDDPRYAMRRFELLSDQVVFQIGDSASAVERYPVARVRLSRSSRGPLYRIRYVGDENALFDFMITLRDDEIRLANQPEFVWRRTGPPGPRPRLIE